MASRVGRQRTRRLTGPHKVAMILRTIDEDAAVAILQNLGDRDIARINRADVDLGTPDEDLIREVIGDFRARIYGSKGGVAGIQSKRLEALIRQAFDESRIAEILGRTDVEIGKIADTLADIDARVIARILTREYPQTCALVLSQLDARQAAEILLALPEDLRVDVMMRIARMEKISEEMLGELNRSLERELAGYESGTAAHEMEGVDLAVQLFMNMDRQTEGSLLDAIEEQDEEIAGVIRQHMFTFEDLLEIDDRGIQMVLRNIENQSLVLALKGAHDDILNKFLSNVSQRVADSLREDLETMGPVRLSEVEGAQQTIANTAREMVERGEIVMPGRGEDELV